MTDTQLKTLAEMVMLNDELLTNLYSLHIALMDEVLPLLPDRADGIRLRSRLEQMSGYAADSAAMRKQIRRYFDLPDDAGG